MLRRNSLRIVFITILGSTAVGCAGFSAKVFGEPVTGWIRTKDGKDIEGELSSGSLAFTIDGKPRTIGFGELLSYESGDPASEWEGAKIATDLVSIGGADFKQIQVAAEELSEIGLPVLTPLLRSYQDTDGHEPDWRYRLFARIVPGYADRQDRTLDLVRLANGDVLRGKVTASEIVIRGADSKEVTVSGSAIRRLAILRKNVERTIDLHALRDSTYVSYCDSGIRTRPNTLLFADATGYVRLSFDEDGWATDPDGIHDPLPGKRRLQEGFRWGSLLGRVGVGGERFFVGTHLEKNDLGSGALYFSINDNEHWQNNVGSFRVKLVATNAYDVGDPH